LPFTWIITKSQPHADSVVIQLRRQGFDALAICCIEHRWLDWPELKQIGAAGPALLFITSRASAARVEVPPGTMVAAIAPTTSATLEARGIRVNLTSHGGVRELAQTVIDSPAVADGTEIFYPTSDAALRQPEHLAGVALLSKRLRVNTRAVYSTMAPDNLAQELAAFRASSGKPGYAFWSPSAIENFAGAGGFDLPPGPVVLVGGSTLRCWQERAPPAWRRAYRHDAGTPLEWSLRFLERDPAAAGSSQAT
jgi:uroporphyrinogen-III synthase